MNRDDLFRRLRGDLFDLHAALAACHDRNLAGVAVQNSPQVDFGANVGGFVHQHLLHRQPLDVHAENLAGHLLGLIRCLRQLDAAGLAPSAHQHLALDDDRLADLFSDHLRLGRRGRDIAFGDGHAILGENPFRLVFV